MQRQTSSCAAFAVALTVVAIFAGRAGAAVVLSDDFNGRANGNADPAGTLSSSWGANNNGLGGTATQTYAVTPQNARGGGQQQTVQDGTGVLRFGAAAINYDLHADAAVVAAKGYTVSFDFKRQAATGFVSVFFGAAPSAVANKDANAAFGPINQTTDYANTVEAAFLFQNNSNVGRVQQYSFGVQNTSIGTAGNIDNAFDDDTTGTIGTHSAVVTVTAPTGFASGNNVTYALSIDGVAVTSYTAVSDGGFGSVGFSSNQAGAFIDNLSIATIPEPAALAAGAVGATMLRRRRRRA